MEAIKRGVALKFSVLLVKKFSIHIFSSEHKYAEIFSNFNLLFADIENKPTFLFLEPSLLWKISIHVEEECGGQT